jgi:hypothetical protein
LGEIVNEALDEIVLRQLQNGQQLGTRLKISNLGLVYSVAARF